MKINDLKGLNATIKVYVPCQPKSPYIERFGALFSQIFGGASAESVQGFWSSEKNGLIVEPIKIVYSFGTIADIEKNLDVIVSEVERMKKDLQQEVVSLEINGSLYFI